MDCDALINVVLKFTTLAASAVCLAIGGRLVSLVLAYAFAGAITFALAAWLYRRLGLPDLHVSGVTARELIYQGVPLLAISVTVTVQPYIDANILYKLVPTGVLGWYGAAWNIAGTLVAPATILAASMYPRLSKASHEAGEFKRALRGAFRPLLVVAVLGAVGTYLFADVAVGIVYSRQKFGPAGGILRAFAPALMLLYIDMLLGTAIMARGGAGRLAGAKVLAVAVTTGLELILVPWCQARFGDGGMGVMFAMTAGELVMVAAAVILIRDAVGGDMIVDALRAAGAGAVTVLLMRLLPPVSPFVAIPVCVLTFLGVASATKLLNRSDVDLLMTAFRSRRAAAISAVDPLSSRAR
jgi:O-antigen/teichoic acid export membrane protein